MSSRPTDFKVGNAIPWSIRTYTDAGVLVDADSTPTVSVYKNGASVADSVTVTKRPATTGIYDCSYNPAGEAEGDTFELTENVVISSQAYENAWSIFTEAAERGTDNASTFDASTDEVVTDTASRNASKADVSESQPGDGHPGSPTGIHTRSPTSRCALTDPDPRFQNWNPRT